MYMHNKRLMYTVRVSEPNPRLATLMLEQFGGPQGELAAAMRYFTQALAECDPGRKDMLHDIATEELSHLEVIGNIVVMLNKGVKAKLAEGAEIGELMSDVFHGGESHLTSILYGGSPALVNSGGVPWSAAYVDSIGDPSCDLRSNIAAESRAKIVYERLINITDDPGIKDALGFLMTREVAHQKAFEKALYAIQQNFPPGKLPGVPEFTNKYYDMSQDGDGAAEAGPWNTGPEWDVVSDREEQAAVDGGDGSASVTMPKADAARAAKAEARTATAIEDPMTGVDIALGAVTRGSNGARNGRSPKHS